MNEKNSKEEGLRNNKESLITVFAVFLIPSPFPQAVFTSLGFRQISRDAVGRARLVLITNYDLFN